ncbi:MAG: hypothetical protein ABI566_14035 [Pseudolysinimonas sp.]
MTAPTEFTRTDATGRLPRWLTLLLATLATLIGIGVLWTIAPAPVCYDGGYVPLTDDVGILPGPQPCSDGGEGPALTAAGILLALLAAQFVVAFTVVRHRRMVMLIIGGAMLLVLLVGLMATAAAANQPVIYY